MPTVYDADIQITMRGVEDSVGLPFTVNPFELADREALIEIRQGPPGAPGPQGEPAWPWIWQGDITNFAALTALGLGQADARKAWRVVAENAVYFWTGVDWIRFANAFQAPGPQGPPTVLTGSATAGATGSSAAASITGTAPNQTLSITLPRGQTGDPGDPGSAGAIAAAADVADLTEARDGSVLAWDAAASRWKGVPNPKLAGPWAVASGQFSAASNINAEMKTVATMTIPAQPVAWRPIVISGHLTVRVHVAAHDDTRVILEVRLGSATGPLIGYGQAISTTNNGEVLMCPRWEVPITPDSTHATVAPNQTATLYVVARRVSGVRAYTIVNQGAQLVVMAQPLKVQP
ncbi:hypothetical protein SAMN04244553_3580 [Nocardia amikacinitolerans]|uniref:Uncharacterized protein n=1 Tax=Nocardia amikacinitolerans TaxID=756689 RepID=A0A285LG37_9NOCA|nr:hypothetical protein [Nocardia amikacinitolerans]SNY83939.1 hypothetical protein SAMN04244553_3580 [Nocardia amikacinitolerans]